MSNSNSNLQINTVPYGTAWRKGVAAEKIDFTKLTPEQISELMSILDFSQLTPEQITELMNILDFTQLTQQQITDLMGILDFSQLTPEQCSDILNCLDFTLLLPQQITDLMGRLDFSQISNQQSLDILHGLDLQQLTPQQEADFCSLVNSCFEPKISLISEVVPSTAGISETVTWTINISNIGFLNATSDVFVTDVIPPGLNYVPGSISGDGADDSGAPNLLWVIPQSSFTASSIFILTYETQATTSGIFSDIINASGGGSDSATTFSILTVI